MSDLPSECNNEAPPPDKAATKFLTMLMNLVVLQRISIEEALIQARMFGWYEGRISGINRAREEK